MEKELEQAVYQTVRFFDLSEQPVTVVQIWRNLVMVEGDGHTRWSGHRVYNLRDIREILEKSEWLGKKLKQWWGYWFLVGRDELMEQRMRRHACAQGKMKLAVAATRCLSIMPFVRMVAVSGSLVLGNAKQTSDLDFLVVVKRGRVWLARLGLLAAAQLTGRRRKYWHEVAPDKICLNHYLADDSLAISTDIRNLYTAVIYHNLVLLAGWECYDKFQEINGTWIKRFLMYPAESQLPPVLVGREPRSNSWFKGAFEAVLSESIFDWLEKLAERWQRYSVLRHEVLGRAGRVVMSDTELAFHPDSKVPGILEKFARDEGQRQLL
ncbi:MAG: nucleotidyltransferase domain-containing protein [Candidatus Andersenbacteria bacterium]|nr:nucleotidyltransferase domain-containing protein [Candidatus Andersenbacteria bacterium]